MIKLSLRLAPIWLAAVLAASPASADIRVTLSDGNGTIYGTAIEAGNGGSSMFNVIGSLFTITANVTNYPGNPIQGGFLTSTLIFQPTQEISKLTVLVEDVVAPSGVANPTPSQYVREVFPLSSQSGYMISTMATRNTGALTLSGTGQVGGFMGLAQATLTAPETGASGVDTTTFTGSQTGFTLAETYTLTNVKVTSPVNVSFSTTVSSMASPNATPEPSTFVLVGLTGLGMAGFGIRRRARATAL